MSIAKVKLKPLSEQEILNLRLIYAVEGFDAATTAALLDAGANPDTKTPYGNPLVYVASAMNKPDVVSALVEGGANKNVLGRKGLNAAGIARSKKIKEYLLTSPVIAKKAKTVLAITKKITKTKQKVLGQKNYLNGVDEQGNTPLHLAISAGSLSGVKALLKAGVDVYAKNKKGATAFHFAAMNKNREILKLIINESINRQSV